MLINYIYSGDLQKIKLQYQAKSFILNKFFRTNLKILMRSNFRPNIRLAINILLVFATFAIALKLAPIAEVILIAFILGIIGMASVFKAVYLDKLKLNCACVGGNAKTPLGIISFIENLLMTIMSALILFK